MGNSDRRGPGGRQQHEQSMVALGTGRSFEGNVWSGSRLVGRPLERGFDRAAEGGQNAHRMSVEWSRIQPTPDTWDEDALDRYRTILRGLRQAA